MDIIEVVEPIPSVRLELKDELMVLLMQVMLSVDQPTIHDSLKQIKNLMSSL